MNKNDLKIKSKYNKMEQSLDNLFNINKSLICKKDELRKKLFEKYSYFKCSEDLKMEESTFFKNVSIIMKDKEFEKLRRKYEKLRYLTCSIDELKEEY